MVIFAGANFCESNPKQNIFIFAFLFFAENSPDAMNYVIIFDICVRKKRKKKESQKWPKIR